MYTKVTDRPREKSVNISATTLLEGFVKRNADSTEFTEYEKKYYYFFYEQIIARGLNPEEDGYKILMCVLRRLFLEENQSQDLNSSLQVFILGLMQARIDRQKDLLKIMLGLLTPFYQNEVINVILNYEASHHSDTFIRDQSLGGQLATVVSEIDNHYFSHLDATLGLQSLVEQNLCLFKNGLNEKLIDELNQTMKNLLFAITNSVNAVPSLIKIMCTNIVKVSSSEEEIVSRLACFFITRYLGGLILKRNEEVFAKTSTGELISSCIRTYVLKFLQSLATTIEPDKLKNLDAALTMALTRENRQRLVIFLKSLADYELVVTEPNQLSINCDWNKLKRMEVDVNFKARFYTICSLYQQGNSAQLASPQKAPSIDKITTPRKTLLKRSSSHSASGAFKAQSVIAMINTDFLKGIYILDFMNELSLSLKRNKECHENVILFEDLYGLCMDFTMYHLLKLCKQPRPSGQEVQKGVWSPRTSLNVDHQDVQLNKTKILSNLDLYLTYLSREGQIKLGLTFLLSYISLVSIKDLSGQVYKKLLASLMETAFVIESESNGKVFDKLIYTVNEWVNVSTERAKIVESNRMILGEILLHDNLEIDAFSKLSFKELELNLHAKVCIGVEN